MTKWHVISWMGDEMYNGKQFNSFEEARGYIDEMASTLFSTEDEQDGYCDDMYAEEIKDEL